MFHFINKNAVIQLILLIAGFALLTFKWTTGVPDWSITDDMPLFSHGIATFCTQHLTLFKGIIVTNLLLQLTLIHLSFEGHNFADEKGSLMPLVFYVWLMNGTANPLHISNIFFINTVVLFMFHISIKFNNPSLKGKVLMLGILIGLGSFLSATVLLFIVYSIISILIYRYSRSKDIVILILGIICPYIYLIAIGYLTDHTFAFTQITQQLSIFDLQSTLHGIGTAKLLLLLALVFLSFALIITQKMQFDNKVILQRRRLTTFTVFTITALFIILTNNSQSPYNLQYIIIPASFYLTIMNQSKQFRWRHDLLTLIYLAVFLLLNFMP